MMAEKTAPRSGAPALATSPTTPATSPTTYDKDDLDDTLPPALPAVRDGLPEELPDGVEHFMVQEDRRVRRQAE